MRISVKVKPNSKVVSVETVSEKKLLLRVRASPKEGEANEAVIEALSEHFNIAKSRIAIIRGHTSRNKIVDIR